MPIIDPADSPSRISPISDVEAPSTSRMVGVRVTHEEIARPGRARARTARDDVRRETSCFFLDAPGRRAKGAIEKSRSNQVCGPESPPSIGSNVKAL